jgi:hypothetical protein
MDQNDLRLRTLLISVGDKLSSNDRVSLSFLLAADVPRRDLETIAHDNRASMNIIWETLINREKISVNNVDYLIRCFEKIGRKDIARQLQRYSTASNSENQVEKAKNSSLLFTRIDPE